MLVDSKGHPPSAMRCYDQFKYYLLLVGNVKLPTLLCPTNLQQLILKMILEFTFLSAEQLK